MGIFGQLFSNVKNMKKAKQLRKLDRDEILSLDRESFYDVVDTLSYDAVYDIHDESIPVEVKYVYSLIQFIMEVNNGGLAQFFVNSSKECAPYILKALEEIQDLELKDKLAATLKEKHVDVNDLSCFEISSVDAFEDIEQQYDFDDFDTFFYEDTNIYDLLDRYARRHIDVLLG